eukprot:m.310843 g.310843  ORF g.310843 m.310843 type:complete len:304 (+) comp20215_c0_seq6:272-1183(+)
MACANIYRLTSASTTSGISSRGLFESWPESRGHMSSESTAGSPCCSATVSVGSTPASPQNVAYQSAMWMYSSTFVPRTCVGRNPPDTNAATRTPPSQLLTLDPFSGQLLAPAPCWKSGDVDQYVGPPLSELKTMSVLSHMSFALRASTTSPSVLSQKEHIAAYCRRSRYQSLGYRSRYSCGASNGVCEQSVARYRNIGVDVLCPLMNCTDMFANKYPLYCFPANPVAGPSCCHRSKGEYWNHPLGSGAVMLTGLMHSASMHERCVKWSSAPSKYVKLTSNPRPAGMCPALLHPRCHFPNCAVR